MPNEDPEIFTKTTLHAEIEDIRTRNHRGNVDIWKKMWVWFFERFTSLESEAENKNRFGIGSTNTF